MIHSQSMCSRNAMFGTDRCSCTANKNKPSQEKAYDILLRYACTNLECVASIPSRSDVWIMAAAAAIIHTSLLIISYYTTPLGTCKEGSVDLLKHDVIFL